MRPILEVAVFLIPIVFTVLPNDVRILRALISFIDFVLAAKVLVTARATGIIKFVFCFLSFLFLWGWTLGLGDILGVFHTHF